MENAQKMRQAALIVGLRLRLDERILPGIGPDGPDNAGVWVESEPSHSLMADFWSLVMGENT